MIPIFPKYFYSLFLQMNQWPNLMGYKIQMVWEQIQMVSLGPEIMRNFGQESNLDRRNHRRWIETIIPALVMLSIVPGAEHVWRGVGEPSHMPPRITHRIQCQS